MPKLQTIAYHIVRIVLGLLWLTNSLEKFFPHFPKIKAIHNGTGNVIGLTHYMIKITPFHWYANLLQASLHLGSLLRYGIATLELFFALSLLTNRFLKYSAVLAILLLLSLELGWIRVEWTFTYAVIAGLHVIVLTRAWSGNYANIGASVLRWLLGVVWIYTGLQHTVSVIDLVVGILFLLGLFVPMVALVGLVLSILLYVHNSLEPWPWVYYTLIVSHLYLMVPVVKSNFAVDDWLRQRRRKASSES